MAELPSSSSVQFVAPGEGTAGDNVSVCRICGNAERLSLYQAREMMFGTREEFEYFQCPRCQCLQIVRIPADLRRFYPPEYYSYSESHHDGRGGVFGRALRRARDRFALGGHDLLGAFLYRLRPYPALRSLSLVRGLTRNTSILDVGCGTGHLLYRLRELGFERLLGIDPFIDADISYSNGLCVKRQELHDAKGVWDLVMFHHTFEHLLDSRRALRAARSVMAPGGCCLLRIPTVTSEAWERYGVHWVGLDAPRHFFLHSRESLRRVAAEAGLSIREIICDSTALQFWGSEQYLRDIPLHSERSLAVSATRSIFSRRKIREFKKRALDLNRAGRGDEIAAVLEVAPR